MIIDALNMRMETEIPGKKTQEAGTGSVYCGLFRERSLNGFLGVASAY